MVLMDTGPLVALLDADDPGHMRCMAALRTLPPNPLLTTWPCFTEAMYLLGRGLGYPGQEALWRMRADGRLIIHESNVSETDRMRELMAKFRDTPMDLADASIVAVAERLAIRRIFTLDSDFYVYRTINGEALEVVP